MPNCIDTSRGWPHPSWSGGWTKSIASWRERYRAAQHLASLDDRALRDIGIDRATVENDSTVSFWRQR